MESSIRSLEAAQELIASLEGVKGKVSVAFNVKGISADLYKELMLTLNYNKAIVRSYLLEEEKKYQQNGGFFFERRQAITKGMLRI